MTNSKDPEQTQGAACSGSSQFCQSDVSWYFDFYGRQHLQNIMQNIREIYWYGFRRLSKYISSVFGILYQLVKTDNGVYDET